jgi:hypothetical protein
MAHAFIISFIVMKLLTREPYLKLIVLSKGKKDRKTKLVEGYMLILP